MSQQPQSQPDPSTSVPYPISDDITASQNSTQTHSQQQPQDGPSPDQTQGQLNQDILPTPISTEIDPTTNVFDHDGVLTSPDIIPTDPAKGSGPIEIEEEISLNPSPTTTTATTATAATTVDPIDQDQIPAPIDDNQIADSEAQIEEGSNDKEIDTLSQPNPTQTNIDIEEPAPTSSKKKNLGQKVAQFDENPSLDAGSPAAPQSSSDDENNENFEEDQDKDVQILDSSSSDSDFDFMNTISTRMGTRATTAKKPVMAPPTTPVQMTPQEIKKYPNWAFQSLNRASSPDNVYLTYMQSQWRNDFHALEVNHAYIQWLFPLFEPGMNHLQTPMTKEEALKISQCTFSQQNMMISFDMMLNFWGFRYDKVNNVVSRCVDNDHMVKAFNNWMCSHNDLRVTRCMKSLYFTGQPEPAMAFLRQLHWECSPDGYPRAKGLRFALDKFWLTIFENDPAYAAECKKLRKVMDSWPTDTKKKGGWFW